MAIKKGTNGFDTLFGTAGADEMYGFDSNDQLQGGGGPDFLDGGDGIDTAWYLDSPTGVTVWMALGLGHGSGGTAEGDTLVRIENLVGSEFNDFLDGDSNDNSLWGAGGDDSLTGGGGADWLYGESGWDDLTGGEGADHLDGGYGFDTAWYLDSTAGVDVNLALGQGWGGTAEGDTLVSIEALYGSAYEDHLIGTDQGSMLLGSWGSDSLKGGGGTDYLHGGEDDDTLTGGGGADWLYGDDGNDTAVYQGSPEGVDVSLMNNGYAAGGDAAGDKLNGIENLIGSEYDDDLWGDNGDNSLYGASGNDSLKGFGGADSLSGREGIDSLAGGGGNDLLNGGNGNDTLWGGLDADTLIGGPGADIFVLAGIEETGTTFSTMDFISDFNSRQFDKIDLHAIDADQGARGHQDFTFVGASLGFSLPGQITYGSDGVDTFIYLNTDANPLADAVIRVAGLHTPDASWFL